MLVNANIPKFVTFEKLVIGETFTLGENGYCYMKIKYCESEKGVYALSLASGEFFPLTSNTRVYPISLKVVNSD